MTPGSGGAASTPQWYQPAIGIFSHLINPPEEKAVPAFSSAPRGGRAAHARPCLIPQKLSAG